MLPANTPLASLNIANFNQPLASYLVAKLATEATRCQCVPTSKGTRADQQHSLCQPQQPQAATSHKVLNKAKLVGSNGSVLHSSHGRTMIQMMPSNAPPASLNIT